MDFRILGPLEVFDGDVRVRLGKPRERALLTALLLHANGPLSRERLVDLVWGESPPRTVNAAVYNSISQLRHSLGSERLVGDSGAYRLIVGEGELDRDRFESLIARGQAAFAEGAHERASALLSEALTLWRGDPFGDVRYEQFAQDEARRLEELHLLALETRIDADLELGRQEPVVVELEALVCEHPWRERFAGQLMLALYRCGRQADALAAYQSAWRALVDELGLEPSLELQALERKILKHDPALELVETAPPTSLPGPATGLIGRERELTELAGILGRGDVRLLTLVGPGGVGKTRLALEVASSASRQVVFADLSPLSSAEQVMPAVAQALGVRETGGQSLAEATTARVRSLDDCLLVVDNCERVLAAAPELAALVASCPELQLLATSREPLHLGAEHEYPVEPLSLESALAVFVERGRRLQPSFAADEEAAELCSRLDCLPLALELAAARTNVLTARQILERLEQHHDLLTAGTRDAPARQQTLHATIDWSYELLDASEKVFFSQLAVFAGGCTLEAAEAVCGAVVDALASLVDKNLVLRRAGRFTMLETIREFAIGVLEGSKQGDDLRRRHIEYFLALADRDYPAGISAETLALIAADYDNLRASLAWSVESAPELALQLTPPLVAHWAPRCMLAEGTTWLEEALRNTPDEPSVARGRALGAASWLAQVAGDLAASRRLGEECLAIGRATGERRVVIRGLEAMSGTASSNAESRLLQEEVVELSRSVGDDYGLSVALGNLGVIASCEGNWDEAIALHTEQLALHAEWPVIAVGELNLALAELQTQHDPVSVANRYEQVFRLATDRAETLYRSDALTGLGITAARAGHDGSAVRVLAAASAERQLLGCELDHPERDVYEETLEQLRARLGEQVFLAAWSEGCLLSPEQAATLALEGIRAEIPNRPTR